MKEQIDTLQKEIKAQKEEFEGLDKRKEEELNKREEELEKKEQELREALKISQHYENKHQETTATATQLEQQLAQKTQ